MVVVSPQTYVPRPTTAVGAASCPCPWCREVLALWGGWVGVVWCGLGRYGLGRQRTLVVGPLFSEGKPGQPLTHTRPLGRGGLYEWPCFARRLLLYPWRKRKSLAQLSPTGKALLEEEEPRAGPCRERAIMCRTHMPQKAVLMHCPPIPSHRPLIVGCLMTETARHGL